MIDFLKGLLIGGGFASLVIIFTIYFSVYILPGNNIRPFLWGLIFGNVILLGLFIAVLYAFAEAWKGG